MPESITHGQQLRNMEALMDRADVVEARIAELEAFAEQLARRRCCLRGPQSLSNHQEFRSVKQQIGLAHSASHDKQTRHALKKTLVVKSMRWGTGKQTVEPVFGLKRRKK